MKLSELVKLRNELLQVETTAAKTATNEIDHRVSRINEFNLTLDYKETVSELIQNLDAINTQLSTIETKVSSIISKIQSELDDRSQDFLARGYIIDGFYGSNSTDVATERNDRTMIMHSGTHAEILVRARKYTDWRYPVLEIGPGDGLWTEHLIAGDPLYIIDVHQEFLNSTLSKFNGVYRNRVRPYLTGPSARKSDTDLSMLPQGQFGFIFSWNVFDFFPLAHTKAFLEQSINLLRPGGYMMFSYNNCDVTQCAEYAERGFKSWMPQSLLVKTCTDLGFEIVSLRSTEETVNWIEIKKPGELKTVKAHQVLGEIISQ